MARKAKKFGTGGSTDRNQARYDRKVADIQSDFEKWKKSGKYGNESVARAKMEQRMADAKNDLAGWRGEDRTATRAAERVAETNLREARRTKGANIAPLEAKFGSEAPFTPKMPSVSDLPQRMASLSTAAAPARSTPRSAPKKPVSRERRDTPTRAAAPTRVPDFIAKAGIKDYLPKPRNTPPAVMRTPSGTGSGTPLTDTQKRKLAEAKERGTTSYDRAKANLARIEGMSERDKVRARMRELGTPGYAKGGKIDGCAVRGKTKAGRK